ncbi:DUF3168 domain-containing protein [Sphingobium sp. PNB]|uniref:tail completion protein gp17 n=1 Tax=Sphingobium sp. PNB TaxID=863934 RepID=UPI001CA3CF4E|nr:DUF3168 domain-containing protein [Sphingobium sp. PNB]MCB4861972.1 DUF3168 domain-containing protein [Sphingobium sp. PNB]
MQYPSYNLQKAVYEILANTVGQIVFHTVPQSQPLPYVKIGDDIIEQDDSVGDFFFCTIHVHVLAESLPKVKLLMAAIVGALGQDIEVEDFETLESHFIQTVQISESDGITAHMMAEFEYVLQPV